MVVFSAISYLLIILHLSLTASAEVLPWDGFLTQMRQEDIAFEYAASPPRTIKNHIFKSKKLEPTAIVFMPGMGEPSLKYYELAKDLAPLHATLYFWDHIGQGFSTHLLPEELEKTHIPSFDLHVETFKNFLRTIRAQHSQVFVVAHSMGGHIALRTAQEAPDLIDKIVATAPMIDIRRYAVPIPILSWLFSFQNPTAYMWGASVKKTGQTPYLTHSEERKEEYQKLLKTYPEARRKWVTVQWTMASLESITILNNPKAPIIEKPVLMLQADTELLVSPSAQENFCSRQTNCTLQKIKNTHHEILVETNPARQEAIDLTKKFLLSSEGNKTAGINK